MYRLLYGSTLVAAFEPKDSAHCLRWSQEAEPSRLRIEGNFEAPVLCREGLAPSHRWGFLASNGSFISVVGETGVASTLLEFPSVASGCDVWWREVSEDVIPPTPELAMPLWEDGRAMTTHAGMVGLCFATNSSSLGYIPLEGPEMGQCHFLADGEPRVLTGGLFHLLQARPKVAPCAEGDLARQQLLRGLRGRIDRFLSQEDHELLERVVSHSGSDGGQGGIYARLLNGLNQLDACQLKEVLSSSRFVAHELNTLGLHVLRSLLAERMVTARTLGRGYTSHPDFPTWHRDGLLIKDLDDPELGGDEGVLKLLRMVSGEETLGIPESLHWQPRNVTVQDTPDPQQQFHIDTFAPIVKVWVFRDPPGVNLTQGPLLFSRRSHRNSEAKLRWMHAYAQPPSAEAQREPSFRLKGCAAATEAASDFIAAVDGKIEMEAAAAATPVLPLPKTRTLVLADTSALHARGPGVPGTHQHVPKSLLVTLENNLELCVILVVT
ncbi:unnamed protein product [Durusdinium trenchii]|uniref:Anaphase-promoting complex subunit 1 n=1 Tax=Durusdinium trenchii TaxID=1381693 RepID=A0ABP0ND06_9DINO